MPQAENGPRDGEAVEARLTYAVDTGEKPVSESVEPGGPLIRRSGEIEDRTVRICNGRRLSPQPVLDVNGFELLRHETVMRDFRDVDGVKRVYYPETADLMAQKTGARRVEIFDHTLRTGDEDDRSARKWREPVRMVHNDYTDWSGPQRIRDILGDEDADAALAGRAAILQLWRPIDRPVERDPFCLCDWRSIAPDDLLAAERRHPGRLGEIYQLTWNDSHRWVAFPHMTRDEAVLFKTWDSAVDGRARFAPHTSFEDPSSPPDAPPRESIEVRAVAVF